MDEPRLVDGQMMTDRWRAEKALRCIEEIWARHDQRMADDRRTLLVADQRAMGDAIRYLRQIVYQ